MTIFADRALLSSGWASNVRLHVMKGCISAIETDVEPVPGEVRHAIMLPGMSNLHSHAFQRAFAGLTEKRGASEDSFWSWRERMYRFALLMNPDDLEAVAAQLYVEMLEAGFTRVGEFHYLHHDRDGRHFTDIGEMAGRIVSAAEVSGIGLTLLPVFYAHSGFGGAAPDEGQRRFISSVDSYAALMEASCAAIAPLPGANIGIAPHSLRAVTPEELRVILPLARDEKGLGGPVHIHISEQVKEVEDCLASLKARPVEWLMANAAVDKNWCLIHATHMSAAETRSMARSGAVAGLCPITEGNLGDGIFNGPEFLGDGGMFGIGSDSNVEISLAGELRLLEYGQRLRLRARNVMGAPGGSTGRSLFEGALKGGAQALQASARLEAGSSADFVTLRPQHADWLMPEGDVILDTLVFAPGSLNVDCVTVRGRGVVEGGRHIAREAIARRYGATMRKLLA